MHSYEAAIADYLSKVLAYPQDDNEGLWQSLSDYLPEEEAPIGSTLPTIANVKQVAAKCNSSTGLTVTLSNGVEIQIAIRRAK